MKKTINRLLLAMAVCAGSAYGAPEEWEDDRIIKRHMQESVHELEEPIKALEKAREAITVHNGRTEVMNQIGQLLAGLNVDLSSVSGSKKPVEEMKKIAQATIDRLDDHLNKNKQPFNETDGQTASNNNRRDHNSRGSRMKY